MTDAYAPPQDPLSILHDDHEVVLVDKPSGLLSVPGKGPHLADCLITRVQAVFPTALLVHRLDRDTSGVMIFALSPLSQRHLGLQFEKRQLRKVYEARVFGRLEGAGMIDAPPGRGWPPARRGSRAPVRGPGRRGGRASDAVRVRGFRRCRREPTPTP